VKKTKQFDDPDGGLENEEFLPNADGKKPIRFTDVSPSLQTSHNRGSIMFSNWTFIVCSYFYPSQFEGKTSFGMSVFNLGNAIMGSGILGLAYAMANTGILLFLFLLTAVAALSSYSVHLLLKSSGIVGIRAYEQLGYRAFGTPGKMAAGIAITLQNIGSMSSYLYIVKSELPLVIQAFLKADPNSDLWYLNGNYLVIMVSACVILPLALMKQLGYLGYTSGFSLSCMVFFLSVVSHKCLESAEFPHLVALLIIESHVSMCSSQTAYTIPILAFAFVCHPEVLPIYTELRNPTQKKMQKVSNISIFVMYTMYFLAALFGYLTFYDNVEPELLHTYNRIDPYDTLILCVRVAVLTAVTLTVPIVLFPVRRAIQQMAFPTKSFNWLRHIAIAIILLTIINMLVIFAPNILGIFGIIGATSAPCLIFIFPAVFYIRIVPKDEEPMNSTPKILAVCFTALGVSFMVMSLSFIIIDWTTGSGHAAGGH
uniref:Solute carrier family 38 member 3 n=1 Tax=Sander lucioperca TaxID=283035 RepID=A0A8D0D6D1_SANLU